MEWSPEMRLLGISYLLLVLKMILLGAYTSYLRIQSGVFATPEDARFHSGAVDESARDQIERSRRAHRNDLESILPFFGVGLLYALTGPSTVAAAIYYLGFAAARILHTIAYVKQWQPHRTVAFSIALVLLVLMTFVTLVSLL